MIGVAQHDIGTKFAHLGGYIALTVPAVPTGMKAGVLIAPLAYQCAPILLCRRFQKFKLHLILRAVFSVRVKRHASP